MKESPRIINIPDLITYGSSFIGGASGQLVAETTKIMGNTDQEKFPLGWESISILEEILEGGISAIGGAIAGKMIYYVLCQKGMREYSYSQEMQYMYIGASIGYASMALILGPLFHQLTGKPDVKWGPFQ